MDDLREEAIFMLLTICKAHAFLDPATEREVLEAALTAFRVLGVSSQELAMATLSLALGDSPIDRTFEGKPKRPAKPMKQLLKDLQDLTAISKSSRK